MGQSAYYIGVTNSPAVLYFTCVYEECEGYGE